MTTNNDENNKSLRVSRTDVAALDAKWAQETDSIKQMIAAPGAPKITINRSGKFQLPDGSELGDAIRVVVVDFISANRYYTSVYNPQNPEPPVCFAFGKILNEMAPSTSSPEPVHEKCQGCPMNEFGSDPRGGRGKACQNKRELAVILEEEIEADDPTIYQLSVPATAIRSFDGFVAQCVRIVGGPPIKAVVTVKAVPQGTFTTLSFTDADNNPEYAYHAQFMEQALELISREPDLSNYVPADQKKGRQAPARR